MYGILQFSRRETIGKNGVQFKPINDNNKYIINTKIRSYVDRWAKVNPTDDTLMEILGVVGNYATESEILKRVYNIKTSKYPYYRIPCIPHDDTIDEAKRNSFTVDCEYTKDMDDALTVYENDQGNVILGVHITDVASYLMKMNEEDKLQMIQWIKKKVSSAYYDNESSPMFPNFLAHDELSLVPNKKRRVISLWIEYNSQYEVVSSKWMNEYITCSDKLTYQTFMDRKPKEYALLSKLSKSDDVYEMIAWCMIKYNVEFVKSYGNRTIILRTKESEEKTAQYEFSDDSKDQKHYNFNSEYTHVTSPIRRLIDLYNQMVFHQHPLFEIDLKEINDKFKSISKFHKSHSVLELSHKTRQEPVWVKVISNKGRYVIIEYDKQRYKIPRFDSYYEGNIPDDCQKFALWGIMRKGQSTLRLCCKSTVINKDVNDEDNIVSFSDNILLKESEVAECMGYDLDDFQLKCLEVLNKDKDLFCTAPTGSGKTTVAMMGILKAFNSGKRAIFSSPIKALSNEKYADFYKRLNGRVSLLTGDMKVRCSPPGGDGAPELLIMTAEILRNKLNINNDLDLKNVSMLIVDECHYISDSDRGPVWEETLLSLPKHISVVSLSATLSSPEDFSKWLSKRRKTICVQHHERHVPLHLGSFINEEFKEVTTTHKIRNGLGVASDIYTWNKQCDANDSPTKLVKILIEQNMCPAIVFCLSRKRCVQMAESITQSLMVSARPIKNKQTKDIEYDAQVLDWNNEVHNHRQRFYSFIKHYLSSWRNELENLPQYKEFIELLYKGVGYHHSGMIPILRELVEVLFREKLIMVVFATESLGVGIDMPARTVIFTQLDKPVNHQYERRNLLTHEFMQMAGRAGRRGKDVKGYVVYYPYPPGKGGIRYQEFNQMVLGKPPKAESQLHISPDFVIRNYMKGITYMDRSLLGYNIVKELNAISVDYYNTSISDDVLRIGKLNDRINFKNTEFSQYMVLNKKQIKKANNEIKELLNKTNLTLEFALKTYDEYNEIQTLRQYLPVQWNNSLNVLNDLNFVDALELTSMGKVASMMSDGFPLVRAQIIMSEDFKKLSFNDIVSWLGIFAWTSPINNIDDSYVKTNIDNIIYYTEELSVQIYDTELKQSYHKTNIIHDWITNKNISNIIQYTGLEEFGTFIKSILRISSFVDEIKQIFLGLEMYDLYNKFENHEERIFYGIVSNASIYV